MVTLYCPEEKKNHLSLFLLNFKTIKVKNKSSSKQKEKANRNFTNHRDTRVNISVSLFYLSSRPLCIHQNFKGKDFVICFAWYLR